MTKDPKLSFQIFVGGFFLFSVGVGAILYAEHRLNPSVFRDVIAFLGILVAGAGALTTLSGYLRLCAGRIVKVFFDDK